MKESLRALNRFGLGARIGEASKISDPRAWLGQQLRPEAALLETGGLLSLSEIGEVLESQRMAQRKEDRQGMKTARRSARQVFVRESLALLKQRAVSETPFLERLVSFWSNHLCVSVRAKPGVLALAGHYERTVIRPHVLGRFSDMVLASARHAAMLLYLDNVRSIGPRSPAARLASRRGRERGLNENYARELLELHTVGVNGGYTQEDVQQLAKVLTGWSLAGAGPASRRGSGNAGNRSAFRFASMLHEPGEKKVMGTRYREGGVREGEKAIRDLCHKQATADFVCGKLVRHFVADEPPDSAIRKIAGIFSETDGDLLEVSKGLIGLEEAWDPANRKFRSPQDWLVAILRALDIREAPPRLVETLQALRQPLWAPPSPQGYADTLKEWSDPDSLMNRAELAQTLSRFVTERISDPSRLSQVVETAPEDVIEDLLADRGIAVGERIALALAGPAFQWR